MAELYAGTSGFSYPTWRPDFYPAGTRAKDFLRAYAERLPSVELNATFHKLPSEEQVRIWAEETPPDFVFAAKMTRRITHFGRIELVSTFCERIRIFGERLGPILIQLPPTKPRDEGWLRLLLDSLDPELDYAFEFRHESWAGVDLEGHALMGSLDGDGPFRYLRLREPPYDDEAIAMWATRLVPLVEDGIDVFVYFKHEDAPDAPLYAERLLALTHVK